jgi:hypothetical protein
VDRGFVVPAPPFDIYSIKFDRFSGFAVFLRIRIIFAVMHICEEFFKSLYLRIVFGAVSGCVSTIR